MALGVSEEHRQLAESVGRWLERDLPVKRVRELDAGGVRDAQLALAGQGMLGLHVAEEHGGGGYGVIELAVVAEQLGRGMFPGSALPTALGALLVQARGTGVLAKEILPGLADGSQQAAVALELGTLRATEVDGGFSLDGSVTPVLGALGADWLVVGARLGDREIWCVVAAAEATVAPLDAFDTTRSLAQVSVSGVVVPRERVLPGLNTAEVMEYALVPFAAEAAGLAAWCLDVAADYAKVRQQFGRPIGQFQGVKHLCADMLVRVEQARAASWDLGRAAHDPEQRPLAAAVAAAVAIDAAHQNALDAIQILGGIGFTFEHDAHIFLRRATTLRQLFGTPSAWRRQVARLALDGGRRTLALELTGAEVDQARARTTAFVESLAGLDERATRQALSEGGYVNPHWPKPWGLEAAAVEQLIIDEVFDHAGVSRPNLFIGGWILPTIIGYGTQEQKEQFVVPTLKGELIWCQLFSEPEAGSDLAAINMKADKVDGGWELTGQKVWTSLAHKAHWGLAIARTDPSAPKHQGITSFLIDMQASEGLDIRPLKEITGNELFNEVFFDKVFVPDAMVVGNVNEGWKGARTTLANERVAMSKGSAMGSSVENVVSAFPSSHLADDPLALDQLGGLVAEGQVLGLIGFRGTLAALSGVEPGSGSSVRKLVGGHHARHCAEFTLELLGPLGATTADAAAGATYMFLQTQCLTIAGGTTNVQKNVIAERMLGLPRDADG
ncbi:MAG: alkylation response protein AidB-like acyl-CoA dehydrogenase [Glaciecola sp.]